MTPRQARFALGAFLLVAGGIAVNVLFLQQRSTANSFHKQAAERPGVRGEAGQARKGADSKQPGKTPVRAPTSLAGGEERAQRTARYNPDSARAEVLPQVPSEETPDAVRAVQRELAYRGYGPLHADGVAGLATRAAIIAYEHDAGLPLTGEATEALLKRLVVGASAHGEPGQAGSVQSSAARQVLRSVQQALFALGFKPGRVDSRLSEDTVRAIREFEVEQGQTPRGRISAELIARLEAAGAGKPPAAVR